MKNLHSSETNEFNFSILLYGAPIKSPKSQQISIRILYEGIVFTPFEHYGVPHLLIKNINIEYTM